MRRRAGTTWAFRAGLWGLLVPAVLMLGLSACGNDEAEQAADPAASNGTGSQVPSGDFLSTAVTAGGQPKKLVEGTTIALTFADGQVRANAGCNTMSGPASFAAGKLVRSV